MSAQLQLFESKGTASSWSVRVSRRARRLSVRVYPGGRVEIVVPPGASPAAVQRFVGTHRDWIHARVEDLSGASPVAAEARPTQVDLPGVQRSYTVGYRADASRSVRAIASGEGVLTVSGNTADTNLIARALRNWLFDLAEYELGRSLAALAARTGLEYRRLQVRLQRTRWGSCSATGTISLNVCVLFQPADVLRYLLVHELCHTKHMNHSRKFWSLVESLEPDYERLDRELAHGWQRVPSWVFTDV